MNQHLRYNHAMYHLGRNRRKPPLSTIILVISAAVGVILIVALLLYQIPTVRENVDWRISNLRSSIKYAISPPEEAVFTPNPTIVAIVQATMEAFTPTPSPSPTPSATAGPTSTPDYTSTPTPTLTPIPSSILLTGIRHEYQGRNNCGPTNLAMDLSFWGWEGSQADTAAILKPNPIDKNVMPYEIADYVETETELKVLVRYAGDLDMLKRLIAAGFPVIIEKGLISSKTGWVGHYQVLAGYDDSLNVFHAYDSYEGDFSNGQTLLQSYEMTATFWRHFNYTYIIIYPPDREAEVLSILGPQADETANYLYAAENASSEIYNLSGRGLFFAWYNRGSSLVLLRDYGGAALAYDEAFKVYADLEPDERPWRVTWYETGPYFAYYFTGRYYDVLNLATQTIDNAGEPALEENWYWRALAKEALGDIDGAIEDYKISLEWHPGFEPTVYQLDLLGVSY
jgi:tetratricopeptide (TPR) repeat protein